MHFKEMKIKVIRMKIRLKLGSFAGNTLAIVF